MNIKRPVPLTPEQLTRAAKRFEWLQSFLITKYHFIHYILGNMTKIPDDRTETMAVRVVAGKFQLHYNVPWTSALKDPEAVYVFYHECGHIMMHHCTTRALDRTGLGNVAQDLAVNELIPECVGLCERPRDEDGKLVGCFVDEMKKEPRFSDIQSMQTAEWYYEYLRKKGVKNDSGFFRFDDHEGHQEDQTADERARMMVNEINARDMWGDTSQAQKELINAAQVRKINWRNLLRSWCGNQVGKERYPTRKRPNRRTGWLFPGSRKSYLEKGLVVADVSGSAFGYDLIGTWLGVVNQLAEDYPIDFMQCDAEVTDGPRTFDRKRIKLEFKGKGGTDFKPIIDMVNKLHYRWVMILTDGEAEKLDPPRMAKVIWVLPRGKNAPVEWGAKVHLERGV